MTDNAALVWHQLRFDLLVFWRSPASVFFTVLLPIIFLFIFQGLFGDERIPELGMKVSTYYVPGILTLAIVSATTQSLAMNLTVDRESGRLKRVRATPLPAVGVRGRQGRNSFVTCVLMVVVVTAIGAIFYGVDRPTNTSRALGLAARDRLRLQLARLRARGPDPERGVRRAHRERRAFAPLLPLGRLHPRDRDPGRGAQGR